MAFKKLKKVISQVSEVQNRVLETSAASAGPAGEASRVEHHLVTVPSDVYQGASQLRSEVNMTTVDAFA